MRTAATPSGFWQGLASLPAGRALPCVWQSRFGADFATVRPFLRPTTASAERFPCRDCDCDHEVRADFEWELASVCTCGECEPRPLARTDVVIHELDRLAFGEVIRRALDFAPTQSSPTTTNDHALEIGTHAPLHAPVLYFAPSSETALLRELEMILAARSGPFLLLAPTRHGFTPAVDSLLHRSACASLALASVLCPSTLSRQPSAALATFLTAWADRVANARNHGNTLLDIHREIAAVRHDFTELRTARDRLEKMLADGFFKFTQKVDATAFKILCSILAEGDAAKAARRLNMTDPMLRYHLRQWETRGGTYAVLLDLVRWRKKVGRKQTVALNEAVFQETTEATDYPGLLSDVLDGLLSMTDDNWSDLCAELTELLRPVRTQHQPASIPRPTRAV